MSMDKKKDSHAAKDSLPKARKYRRGLLTIMAGILTMVLFCLTLSLAVLIQFGVERVALANINDETYYMPQSQTLEDRVKKLTRDYGLPESIADGVFESEEILAFTKEYTRSRMLGLGGELNAEPVKERLRANLYYYMEAEGIDKGRLNMEAQKQYLSQAVSVYVQTLNNGFVTDYQKIQEKVMPVAAAGTVICGLLVVLCMFYMYKLTGMRRKMLSYTIRAMIASVLLCGALALWRFGFHGQTGLTYGPEYMKYVCEAFENFFFGQFGLAALLWAIAAAGCGLGILKLKFGNKGEK